MRSYITDLVVLPRPREGSHRTGPLGNSVTAPWRASGAARDETRCMTARCLGGFSLYLGDDLMDEARWNACNGGSRRVEGVMAYLIAHRHEQISKNQLIDTFWEQADGDRAHQSLDRTISALRRALEPDLQKYQQSSYILGPRGGYRFAPDLEITVDAEDFVAYYKKGLEVEGKSGLVDATPYYRQAEALYVGPFMDGVPYAELWAHHQSQILADYHRIVLTRLANAAWRAHDFDGVTDYAHRALGEYGCQGELCGLLINAYLKRGLAAIAHRHIETCPYREQLNGAPCPDLSMIFRQ